MNTHYTSERNTQILISLMKEHGVRKIVASPGTTNICLVASLQQDPYFEIYSSVDERSAAYIACGMAAESGEPVALSCTGATASRNYIPGLTEAYYRKLPILAITSTQHIGRIGHYMPQVIDRTNPLNDIAKISVQIPTCHEKEDEWSCNTLINNALLSLTRDGGGPVHINLTTTYSEDFSIMELPKERVIRRVYLGDEMPELKQGARIGIFVGNHKKWSMKLTTVVDEFCEKYGAIVFCDHTSKYHGKYRAFAGLLASQAKYKSSVCQMEVMITFGEVSGTYLGLRAKKCWRVDLDGEVRDTYRNLTHIFQMTEEQFFEKYNEQQDTPVLEHMYYKEWVAENKKVKERIPELPFSNAWIARNTINELPENCVVHLGILNTLRTWNYFDCKYPIDMYSNTGGFGIDGMVSSIIGASLASPDKLIFGVIGDLGFFYDLNAIGNRHLGSNVRILMINNGKGTEFRNYDHKAAKFGEDANAYMAAAGHYGNQSKKLVKNYSENLGFEYISASNKEEYLDNLSRFVNPEFTNKPMLFEVFTNSQDESEAIRLMRECVKSVSGNMKQAAKDILGAKNYQTMKKIVKGK